MSALEAVRYTTGREHELATAGQAAGLVSDEEPVGSDGSDWQGTRAVMADIADGPS